MLQFLWHLPRMRTLGVGFRFVAPRRTPELSAVIMLTLAFLAIRIVRAWRPAR